MITRENDHFKMVIFTEGDYEVGYFRHGLLVAGMILAFLGVGNSVLNTLVDTLTVDMHIEPSSGTRIVGEEFTVSVVVQSNEPVNVFKGDVHFDPDMLYVSSIDYNTSIADLWAKRPWYENGGFNRLTFR